MKKILISILFLLFFLSTVYATVDRVIDPEIPIDSELINYEQNFDDVLISLLSVGVLGLATVSGSVFIFLLIFFVINRIRIF